MVYFFADPGQPLSASAMTFVTLLVIIVIGGIGFLLWRMQLQKKLINHLTSIVFREVGAVNGSNSTVGGMGNQSLSNSRAHVPATNGGMEFTVSTQQSNHI